MKHEKFIKQPDTKEEVATMSYMSHEMRMVKAYERELMWKVLFVVSNCLWITGLFLSFLLR